MITSRAPLLLLLLLAGCQPAPPAAPASGSAAAAAADPWPECAEVRRMMLAQTGEPGQLEVLSWEGRHQVEDPGPLPAFAPSEYENGVARSKTDEWRDQKRDADAGAVYVTLRVREVNRFGAREVRQKTYKVVRAGFKRKKD